MVLTPAPQLAPQLLRYLERVDQRLSGKAKTPEQLALLDLRYATLPIRKEENLIPFIHHVSRSSRQAVKQYGRRDQFKTYRHFTIGGKPGSGKSTQSTQVLLRILELAGDGRAIMIVVPGRFAALLLCDRLRAELGVEIEDNDQKGIVVLRSRDNSGPAGKDARIVVVTEGICVREVMGDIRLGRYAVVLFDEVQEQSGYSEVLIDFAKWAMRASETLRIGLISGTSDLAPTRNFLNIPDAAHCTLPAPTFPVQVSFAAEPVEDITAWVIVKLSAFIQNHTGDILIFTNGLKSCTDLGRAIKAAPLPEPVEVHPVTSRVSQQRKIDATVVRAPDAPRRVIIGTNSLEDTITIPNIGLVMDTLMYNLASYSTEFDHRRLIERLVSRVQIEQRIGRAGRTQPGYAELACTKEMYDLLLATYPELLPKVQTEEYTSTLLTNLAVTRIINARYGDFPTGQMELSNETTPARYAHAVATLKVLQAVTEDSAGNIHLTDIGRQMANLSVSPEFARSLIASVQFNGVKAKGQLLNCTGAMIVLVAANSTTDVLRQSIFFSSQEDAEGQYDLQQQSTLMSTQGDHVSAFLALRGWLNGKGNGTDQAGRSRAITPFADAYATKYCLRKSALSDAADLVKTLTGQMKRKGMFHFDFVSLSPNDTVHTEGVIRSLIYGHLRKFAFKPAGGDVGEYHRWSNGQERLFLDEKSRLYAASPQVVLLSDARMPPKPASPNNTIINQLSITDPEWYILPPLLVAWNSADCVHRVRQIEQEVLGHTSLRTHLALGKQH
ncbi:P-loop containing nucleoside triphosphate hydrolase protein [Dioszegia hungarica]|uniref:P-loop containing nucleoside triphosphate hydrolase protein n=1 Tax=Dioszegia hungarica TaxID=4972 RepID=A0AA38LV22_9TREE|nr:P-loop containing nucleoside triphosphate hydrolase protein [Dioszegia hungarica]KAI9634726.1 P-loop containing nucleoside triphosphate hydrolase protein [Dioszegia hungarica]